MYNIDKIDGLTPLTVSQMEETDGGLFGLVLFVSALFLYESCKENIKEEQNNK